MNHLVKAIFSYLLLHYNGIFIVEGVVSDCCFEQPRCFHYFSMADVVYKDMLSHIIVIVEVGDFIIPGVDACFQAHLVIVVKGSYLARMIFVQSQFSKSIVLFSIQNGVLVSNGLFVGDDTV